MNNTTRTTRTATGTARNTVICTVGGCGWPVATDTGECSWHPTTHDAHGTTCTCEACIAHLSMAHGLTTVCSSGVGGRTECHAPSGYGHSDFSGSASNGARARQRDMILTFWESRGMARWQNGGAGGGGAWYVRDNAQGASEWLRLATQGEGKRADVAEFSHVRSSANGGAWCACGVIGESGLVNLSRADRNMVQSDIAPAWADTLAAWPAYWQEHVARKASLKRLGA